VAVARYLGIDPDAALRASEDFCALPHRQQEIGEIDGVLYVDDSISTTPESAIAALDVYRHRTVTIIIGGQDRGIDYSSLVDRLSSRPPGTVILLDPSGRRIGGMLGSGSGVFLAESMRDAVHLARSRTPRGGVVLLSPAAPSYGSYRSFVERGEDFARCAGIRTDRPGTA
jgi:UDP-N-acetylmuramoylalanine--D-glutamate ligase